MFWAGNRINAVKVKGKDLKSLVHKPYGVLVYYQNELFFVAFSDPIKLVLSHLPQKAEEKAVFISDEFAKIKDLNDDEEYLVVFKEYGELQIWDRKYQNMKTLLYGITL
ncbi:MAG: hypothetical protein L7H07_02870 [Candidatus Nanopusillus sp.]|nr:hypothetical protein [Candidatus Nanopusillus sp.]